MLRHAENYKIEIDTSEIGNFCRTVRPTAPWESDRTRDARVQWSAWQAETIEKFPGKKTGRKRDLAAAFSLALSSRLLTHGTFFGGLLLLHLFFSRRPGRLAPTIGQYVPYAGNARTVDSDTMTVAEGNRCVDLLVQ